MPFVRLHFAKVPDVRVPTLQSVLLVVLLLLIDSDGSPQVSPDQSKFQLYEEAQQAMAQADYDRAVRVYQKLVHINSKSAPLFLQLGIAEYQKEDYNASATALRLAMELQP